MGLAKTVAYEDSDQTGRNVEIGTELSGAEAATARLMPGMDRRILSRKKRGPRSVGLDGSFVRYSDSHVASALARCLPQLCRGFAPRMLGTAFADLLLMRLTILGESRCIGASPNVAAITFYLFAFLIFAIPEGLYRGNQNIRASETTVLKTLAWTSALSALALTVCAHNSQQLSIVLWSAINFVVLSGARWLYERACRTRHWNALIIGSPLRAQLVVNGLKAQQHSWRSVRAILSERNLCDTYGLTMLRTIARKESIDEIIVASDDPIIIRSVIEVARRDGLDVCVVPNLAGNAVLALESLAGFPLLTVNKQSASEWTLAIKRLLDVALSAAALVLLSPLLALIALGIKLDSSGPVLYRSLRTGFKGHRFLCYKFRTMAPDADALKDELRLRNERRGAFFKINHDPRITHVGRWLRRYSLDELPQLWNVLIGDMSLVGPRPHPLDDVGHYRLQDLHRLDFVPGMTGLWQVTARRDPSFEHSVSLDVHYIRNWSLLLDFQILWRTAKAVFSGSGI